MAITVTDLAKHCGVSQPTVSRILNGDKASFNVNTVALVEKTAQELGFRKNNSALATRDRKTRGVAFLMDPQLDRSYSPRSLIHGVHQALKDCGKHMLVDRLSDADLLNDQVLPKFLTHQLVDGLIINYQIELSKIMKKRLVMANMPTVWVNAKRATDAVYPDEKKTTHLLAQQMIHQGCTRIIFADPSVTGIPLERLHYCRGDRLEGYLSFMQESDLQEDVVCRKLDADFYAQLWDGQHKTGLILGESSPAIMHEIWKEIYSRGFQLGHQLVVGTFGDEFHLDKIPILLAKPNWVKIAQLAVEMLNSTIDGAKKHASKAVVGEIEITEAFKGL